MREVVNVFLPMRAGSQRVPQKNTRPFAGMEGGLCSLKIKQLLGTKLIQNITISTNDPEVMDIIRRVKPSCGGKYGYFSGHASNSFAMATFFITLFAHRFKQMRLLFVVAAFVAYSRIYIGVHYPLDVLSGTLFGLFSGWLFAKIYLRFIPSPI